MEPINDISIGQDQWIKWVEFDPHDKNELYIDNHLLPINEFWINLETVCIAGCCGIQAFALWPEDIRFAARDMNTDNLKAQLLNMKNDVMQSQCNIIGSSRLNNRFDKKVFIELIDHILTCV